MVLERGSWTCGRLWLVHRRDAVECDLLMSHAMTVCAVLQKGGTAQWWGSSDLVRAGKLPVTSNPLTQATSGLLLAALNGVESWTEVLL